MNFELIEAFRSQTIAQSNIQKNDWESFQNLLYENGIGMEETLKYLFTNQPTEEIFKNWFIENRLVQAVENAEIEPDVLNDDDFEFWNKNGYVVIKNAISKQDCKLTQNAIFEFLDASIDKPETWYNNHEAKEGLMLLFTKHETLEKNRNSAKIKRAYEQLYQTKEIYKTIDKVSFNPPENKGYKFMGSRLHWDVSLYPPIPFRLQGLLYLTDVTENSGAFHCVPGFHNSIENWLQNLPKNSNPRETALTELVAKPVLGEAGDFIIWHQALPHCATANTSNLPRLVQYLTYLPKNSESVADIWI